TAECTERLLGVVDALGAPKPEVGGQRDPRSAAQRRHDALLDALKLLPLADALPTAAGVATTVIVTMDAAAYRTGRGIARTSHGATVPAAEALKWAGGDLRLLTVALDSMGRVEAQSSTARLFSETQRLALIARDRGCCFPACDTPPAWTEIHHVEPWAVSKNTSLDNGAMVCGFHHRTFERLGWTCIMQDGRPAWIPPPHIDPQQKPMRNHLHQDPEYPSRGP
ncbi:MAG TPA: DUF222 domain-containing protein, partial [Jatrophihabitans sp.]|nr:DUF222 domain-containing protein [Jatrophihabitans sp.]